MMSKKAYVMISTQNLCVTLWISNFMSATGHLGFMMLKTEEEEERDITCHLESKFLTFL
jgi:hypothetical protein